MLIDAHAHIDRYDLLGEHALESALAEIVQHRILTISNSMDLPSYRRNLEIGQACDLVLPLFGVHPWNAPEYAHHLEKLDKAIESSPMIGEIGLDHHFVKDSSAYPAQRRVLEYLMAAARDQDKIVTLHTKGAERDVLEFLDRYQVPRVIVHWYSGPLEIFREMVARGVYFTVGIEVLHSAHIRTIARMVPSERLLTETDNPGGPKGFRGEPGMPLLLKSVVQGVAEARETTVETVVQTVQANLAELFGGDPWLAESWGALLAEGPTGG